VEVTGGGADGAGIRRDMAFVAGELAVYINHFNQLKDSLISTSLKAVTPGSYTARIASWKASSLRLVRDSETQAGNPGMVQRAAQYSARIHPVSEFTRET